MFKKVYRIANFSDLECKLGLYTYGFISVNGINNTHYDEERPLKYLRAKYQKNTNLQTEIAIAGLIRSYENRADEHPETKEEMDKEIETLLNVMNRYGHYKKNYFNDLSFSFRKDIKLRERQNFNAVCKIIRAKYEKTYSKELKETIENEKAKREAEKQRKAREKAYKKSLKKEVKRLR